MHVLMRGDYFQRARLLAGLILFTFAATHFLNHALGIISVQAMHDMENWRTLVTRSIVGSVILGAALLFHVLLALWKLSMRTTLRMPIWEAAQILTGILIPFLLLPHIVNTRVATTYFNVNDNYLYELARLWPDNALLQSTLLVLVWVHGSIGIHYWCRLWPSYRAAQPILLFLAIAVPLAALTGFMISGRAVARLMEDPQTAASIKEVTRWPNAADNARLGELRFYARLGFGGALGLVVLFMLARRFMHMRGATITVTYIGGPTIEATAGPTILEISRMHNVPHASVCGGRARCSTCRIRIDSGGDDLAPPVFPESVTLGSIHAPHNVRLACQIRPASDITVTRLLRPVSTGPEAAELSEEDSDGVEKRLAVLFIDLRDFTKLTENRLPYDVVYILNEFFRAAGAAIADNGGWIDKFMGDGLLAVFGQRHGVEAGCRQALRAMRAMDLALDHVNAKLAAEVGKPLKIGAGLHAGPLLIGRIGHGDAVDMTVIGEAVNVASRLERMAKEQETQLVLSNDVAKFAGWDIAEEDTLEISVRGMSGPMRVITITRGRDLPPQILAPGAGEEDGVIRRGANRARPRTPA